MHDFNYRIIKEICWWPITENCFFLFLKTQGLTLCPLCLKEHFVKSIKDLDILSDIVEATVFSPRFDKVISVIEQIGSQGQTDIVIPRSPFGKLVQEYMGFENAVYGLFDSSGVIRDFLCLQQKKDLELIRLACKAPARLVIISDHADENLISPKLYEQYCVPYYKTATDILHEAAKFVSTHLDGNFKGHFPLLGKTGFDLLDGCTPSPMFNYEIEELAAALPEGMSVFCGVPSSLFCQQLPSEEIFSLAERILNSFRGRGIINIGDILPPNGDIEQVISLGEYVAKKQGL
jgi:uroporphyrinogen-III decarboxylase